MIYKRAFSLIEVVISLLIISITFIAFSELLSQNINVAQQSKQISKLDQQQLNLMTLYTVEPSIEQQNLNKVFPNSKLTTRNIGNIGIYQELSIQLTTQENNQLNIVILR
jgi:prepilin-type N-terminal cleavage/methylation domain-containing protein